MSIVLEELYKDAELLEKYIKADTANHNRLEQCYNNLRNNLTSSQLHTLNKLIKSEYSLNQTENIRFFINGFRLGLSLKD